MANKKLLKEAKQEKKERRKGKSSTNLWVAVGVLVAAAVVAMPQLMKMSARTPDGEINLKLSFPTPPDARPAACQKDESAKHAQGTVSIIIPYLNEEWFRIEATMQSLVKYTDMSLVLEIMWISDGNTADKVFAKEIKAMHSKVSIHENPENLGLIMTKMQAATRARGSVLMFLEPHVVVTHGWLQPLLNRLKEEPKALIMPALDALAEDMKYNIADPGIWRFEWNLNLVHANPGDVKKSDKPYMSPATSGGIYAIRKDFWESLELFDPELVRWGGDHVEATHKVWRCGGRIEVHPCSRVGHWFREVEQRPYDVKVESVIRNYKRLVEVWFDDYNEYFYKVKPEAIGMDTGNVSDMKERRSLAQCKDMEWYVKNVDVELGWEMDKICIPNTDKEAGGCGQGVKAAHRHSTITKEITVDQYKQLTANAEAFQVDKKLAPCCRALGRGCKRICGPGESPSS